MVLYIATANDLLSGQEILCAPSIIFPAAVARGLFCYVCFHCYHCRLVFTPSSRHSAAYVNHNNGTKVVQASTTELCLARHLYKTSDVSAAYNVGRLVAHRCKEMGLHRVMWEHKADRNHKRVGH